MRPVVALALLLVVPALAGCLGADPAPVPPPEDPDDPVPSLAVVEITVLDPGRVPVPDAPVTLTTTAGTDSAVTNVLGIVRFENVPPGNVTVHAGATGFLPAALTFPVQAGQHAVREIVLARDGPTTRVETLEFEGFFDCAATTLIITGDCFVLLTYLGAPSVVNPTNEEFIFPFTLGPGWTLLRITQTWDEPEIALGSMMRVNLEPYEPGAVEHNDRYARGEGASPIVVELFPGELHENASDEEQILPLEGAPLQTRSFHIGFADLHNPGGTEFLGAGAAYQQRFHVLIEMHYES